MALSRHLYLFQDAGVAALSPGLNNSPWKCLPSELTLDIYERLLPGVLRHGQPIQVETTGGNVVPSLSKQEARALVALCKICREIREEALSFFFSRNTFEILLEMKDRSDQNLPNIVASTDLAPFHRFMDLIEPWNLKEVKISLNIGTLFLVTLKDMWMLRQVLKSVASRKTANLPGECMIHFSMRGFYNNEEREHQFVVDGWYLRASLLAFKDEFLGWLPEVGSTCAFRNLATI